MASRRACHFRSPTPARSSPPATPPSTTLAAASRVFRISTGECRFSSAATSLSRFRAAALQPDRAPTSPSESSSPLAELESSGARLAILPALGSWFRSRRKPVKPPVARKLSRAATASSFTGFAPGGQRGSPAGREEAPMEFGMFHEFQSRAGRSEAESFADAFAEVDAAERWGLDAMWLAELYVDS